MMVHPHLNYNLIFSIEFSFEHNSFEFLKIAFKVILELYCEGITCES
jgi:hypothetical protein